MQAKRKNKTTFEFNSCMQELKVILRMLFFTTKRNGFCRIQIQNLQNKKIRSSQFLFTFVRPVLIKLSFREK